VSHVASVAVEVEQRGHRLGALLRLGYPEGVQGNIVGGFDADRNVGQVVHRRNGYVNAGVGWQVRMIEQQVLGIVKYHCNERLVLVKPNGRSRRIRTQDDSSEERQRHVTPVEIVENEAQ